MLEVRNLDDLPFWESYADLRRVKENLVRREMIGGEPVGDGVIGYVDGSYHVVRVPGGSVSGSVSEEERKFRVLHLQIRITVENVSAQWEHHRP